MLPLKWASTRKRFVTTSVFRLGFRRVEGVMCPNSPLRISIPCIRKALRFCVKPWEWEKCTNITISLTLMVLRKNATHSGYMGRHPRLEREIWGAIVEFSRQIFACDSWLYPLLSMWVKMRQKNKFVCENFLIQLENSAPWTRMPFCPSLSYGAIYPAVTW